MRKAIPHQLQFLRPAGTSKGFLETRDICVMAERAPSGGWKLGEASPLGWLSKETQAEAQADAVRWAAGESFHSLSVRCGAEMVAQDDGAQVLYPSAFTEGRAGIPINGLVWMGPRDYIDSQIRSLLDRGFGCIKMKVGAASFDEELEVIRQLRAASADVEIRVDANGAFSHSDAPDKLARLAEAGVYSIEQPIAPGQSEAMAALCASGTLRIALDEELIPVQAPSAMADLLDTVRPAMIVLKPSLIGGFAQAERWIALAEARGIGWWVTSALESNIGLNAIAQWAAAQNPASTQGLGTGSLYANNFASPLEVRGDALWHDPERGWDLTSLGLR